MKRLAFYKALPALAAAICMLAAACSTAANDPPPQTAATPTATPAGGQVADNTAITLATATAGAKLYYTQDETEPDTTSALYSDSDKPVITTGKLTLKAIAVKDGMNNSATLTAVYTITTAQNNSPPGITNAGIDLPANTGALTADGLTVNLTGAAADPDGDTLSYQWKCTEYDNGTYVVTGADSVAAGINSGIGGASGNGTAAVTLRKAGTYTFKLSVSDSVNSAVESEPVTVTVGAYTYDEDIKAKINIAEIPFVAGTEQKFYVDSNFYSLEVIDGQVADFADENTALVTYTVVDETANPNIVWNSSDGPVTVYSTGYPNWLRTFTQTFTYKDKNVSHSIRLVVCKH